MAYSTEYSDEEAEPLFEEWLLRSPVNGVILGVSAACLVFAVAVSYLHHFGILQLGFEWYCLPSRKDGDGKTRKHFGAGDIARAITFALSSESPMNEDGSKAVRVRTSNKARKYQSPTCLADRSTDTHRVTEPRLLPSFRRTPNGARDEAGTDSSSTNCDFSQNTCEHSGSCRLDMHGQKRKFPSPLQCHVIETSTELKISGETHSNVMTNHTNKTTNRQHRMSSTGNQRRNSLKMKLSPDQSLNHLPPDTAVACHYNKLMQSNQDALRDIFKACNYQKSIPEDNMGRGRSPRHPGSSPGRKSRAESRDSLSRIHQRPVFSIPPSCNEHGRRRSSEKEVTEIASVVEANINANIPKKNFHSKTVLPSPYRCSEKPPKVTKISPSHKKHLDLPVAYSYQSKTKADSEFHQEEDFPVRGLYEWIESPQRKKQGSVHGFKDKHGTSSVSNIYMDHKHAHSHRTEMKPRRRRTGDGAKHVHETRENVDDLYPQAMINVRTREDGRTGTRSPNRHRRQRVYSHSYDGTRDKYLENEQKRIKTDEYATHDKRQRSSPKPERRRFVYNDELQNPSSQSSFTESFKPGYSKTAGENNFRRGHEIIINQRPDSRQRVRQSMNEPWFASSTSSQENHPSSDSWHENEGSQTSGECMTHVTYASAYQGVQSENEQKKRAWKKMRATEALSSFDRTLSSVVPWKVNGRRSPINKAFNTSPWMRSSHQHFSDDEVESDTSSKMVSTQTSPFSSSANTLKEMYGTIHKHVPRRRSREDNVVSKTSSSGFSSKLSSTRSLTPKRRPKFPEVRSRSYESENSQSGKGTVLIDPNSFCSSGSSEVYTQYSQVSFVESKVPSRPCIKDVTKRKSNTQQMLRKTKSAQKYDTKIQQTVRSTASPKSSHVRIAEKSSTNRKLERPRKRAVIVKSRAKGKGPHVSRSHDRESVGIISLSNHSVSNDKARCFYAGSQPPGPFQWSKYKGDRLDCSQQVVHKVVKNVVPLKHDIPHKKREKKLGISGNALLVSSSDENPIGLFKSPRKGKQKKDDLEERITFKLTSKKPRHRVCSFLLKPQNNTGAYHQADFQFKCCPNSQISHGDTYPQVEICHSSIDNTFSLQHCSFELKELMKSLTPHKSKKTTKLLTKTSTLSVKSTPRNTLTDKRHFTLWNVQRHCDDISEAKSQGTKPNDLAPIYNHSYKQPFPLVVTSKYPTWENTAPQNVNTSQGQKLAQKHYLERESTSYSNPKLHTKTAQGPRNKTGGREQTWSPISVGALTHEMNELRRTVSQNEDASNSKVYPVSVGSNSRESISCEPAQTNGCSEQVARHENQVKTGQIPSLKRLNSWGVPLHQYIGSLENVPPGQCCSILENDLKIGSDNDTGKLNESSVAPSIKTDKDVSERVDSENSASTGSPDVNSLRINMFQKSFFPKKKMHSLRKNHMFAWGKTKRPLQRKHRKNFKRHPFVGTNTQWFSFATPGNMPAIRNSSDHSTSISESEMVSTARVLVHSSSDQKMDVSLDGHLLRHSRSAISISDRQRDFGIHRRIEGFTCRHMSTWPGIQARRGVDFVGKSQNASNSSIVTGRRRSSKASVRPQCSAENHHFCPSLSKEYYLAEIISETTGEHQSHIDSSHESGNSQRHTDNVLYDNKVNTIWNRGTTLFTPTKRLVSRSRHTISNRNVTTVSLTNLENDDCFCGGDNLSKTLKCLEKTAAAVQSNDARDTGNVLVLTRPYISDIHHLNKPCHDADLDTEDYENTVFITNAAFCSLGTPTQIAYQMLSQNEAQRCSMTVDISASPPSIELNSEHVCYMQVVPTTHGSHGFKLLPFYFRTKNGNHRGNNTSESESNKTTEPSAVPSSIFKIPLVITTGKHGSQNGLRMDTLEDVSSWMSNDKQASAISCQKKHPSTSVHLTKNIDQRQRNLKIPSENRTSQKINGSERMTLPSFTESDDWENVSLLTDEKPCGNSEANSSLNNIVSQATKHQSIENPNSEEELKITCAANKHTNKANVAVQVQNENGSSTQMEVSIPKNKCTLIGGLVETQYDHIPRNRFPSVRVQDKNDPALFAFQNHDTTDKCSSIEGVNELTDVIENVRKLNFGSSSPCYNSILNKTKRRLRGRSKIPVPAYRNPRSSSSTLQKPKSETSNVRKTRFSKYPDMSIKANKEMSNGVDMSRHEKLPVSTVCPMPLSQSSAAPRDLKINQPCVYHVTCSSLNEASTRSLSECNTPLKGLKHRVNNQKYGKEFLQPGDVCFRGDLDQLKDPIMNQQNHLHNPHEKGEIRNIGIESFPEKVDCGINGKFCVSKNGASNNVSNKIIHKNTTTKRPVENNRDEFDQICSSPQADILKDIDMKAKHIVENCGQNIRQHSYLKSERLENEGLTPEAVSKSPKTYSVHCCHRQIAPSEADPVSETDGLDNIIANLPPLHMTSSTLDDSQFSCLVDTSDEVSASLLDRTHSVVCESKWKKY